MKIQKINLLFGEELDMKVHLKIINNFFLIIFVSLILFIILFFQPVFGQETLSLRKFIVPDISAPLSKSVDPLVTDTIFKLRNKIKEQGHIRVIVGIKVPFAPEGYLSTLEVETQRNEIKILQESLVSKIEATGGEILALYETIPFISVRVDEVGLEFLLNSEDVITIEEDKMLKPLLKNSIPQIGANVAWDLGYTGEGQTVAIIDTGVDKYHPFLAGKVVSEACFSTSDYNNLIEYYISTCPGGLNERIGPGSALPCDLKGCDHGTHVAGISAGKGPLFFSGVAKDAKIIAINAFTARYILGIYVGVLSLVTDQLKALEHVYKLRNQFKISSVNLSLGGGVYSDPSRCDTENPGYKSIIDNLKSVGIATIAASGNDEASNGISFPACISSAISVGATEFYGSSEKVAEYSNSHPSLLTFLAPGGCDNYITCEIYSSIPGGKFDYKHGTSMAAAHVSGAWAVLKSAKSDATVDEIKKVLTDTGDWIVDKRNNARFRRINVEKAVKALTLKPNLKPYRPSGWPDSIVVSKVRNTNNDDIPLYTTDELYVDFAIINDSKIPINSKFFINLYIDGIYRESWYCDSIEPNGWVYVSDFPIGTLSYGSHSIKIVIDPQNVITESNEGDNEYIKTINVEFPPLSVSPSEGTLGTELTIKGGQFGSIKGKVYLGEINIKILEWRDDLIRCLISKPIWPGIYNIKIEPKEFPVRIIEKSFIIKQAEISSIEPQFGFPGDQIKIKGKFFGNKKGSVYLKYPDKGFQKRKNCRSVTWYMDPLTNVSEITFVVPKIPYVICNLGVDPNGIIPETELENGFTVGYQSETISKPNAPNGPVNGRVGENLTFSIGGASSSLGHPIQYLFDWGDGSNSGWLTQGQSNASHIWNSPGNYSVKARARCAIDNTLSDWSEPILVSIASSPGPNKPNLTPYQPPGCSDKIVITKTPCKGNPYMVDETPFYSTDVLYPAWWVINNGSAPSTTTAEMKIFLDGELVHTNIIAPLQVSQTASCCLCLSIGPLSPGQHTLKIVVDTTNKVDELDENDNEYVKTFTVN